ANLVFHKRRWKTCLQSAVFRTYLCAGFRTLRGAVFVINLCAENRTHVSLSSSSLSYLPFSTALSACGNCGKHTTGTGNGYKSERLRKKRSADSVTGRGKPGRKP